MILNKYNLLRILFLIISFILMDIITQASCIPLEVYGGQENLTAFPVYVEIPSNKSALINTITWGNVRFYNSPCSYSGTQLSYEIDTKNRDYGSYWVLMNLTANDWNSYSIVIGPPNQLADENATTVWQDYKHVYHFSEFSGKTTKDSTIQNYTLFRARVNKPFYGFSELINRTTLNCTIQDYYTLFRVLIKETVTKLYINWAPSPAGFGSGIFINPSNLDNYTNPEKDGGSDGLISLKNTTSDLSGNNDRSIFAWGQIIGSPTNNHGVLFGLGLAKPNNYYNLRYELNKEYRIDYNGDRWDVKISANKNRNYYYIQHSNSTEYFLINEHSYESNNHTINTMSAPIQIGCAFGINLPYTGAIACWNGTIDEVRIATKIFSSAYVNRTYQLTNKSKIQIGEEIITSRTTI